MAGWDPTQYQKHKEEIGGATLDNISLPYYNFVIQRNIPSE